MKVSIQRSAISILLCVLCVLCGESSVAAQASDCPADKVCLSRDAALKALADADKVTAYEAEIKVKDQAIDDLKELLNKMRIEFAAISGEATALRQNAVSDRAIIDILLKNVRPKKIGLINF